MEYDNLPTDTLITEQLTSSLTDMLPALIIGSVVSLAVLIILALISAHSHRRQKRAILQTAEDVHVIRELLESHFGPSIHAQETHVRPKSLENDPQLPPRP